MRNIFIVILIIIIFIVIYLVVLNNNKQKINIAQNNNYENIENIKNISLINIDAKMFDQITLPLTNINTINFNNQSNKSDTNKPLDDQSNKSNTNKPLDDQSNKPLDDLSNKSNTNKPLDDQSNKPLDDQSNKPLDDLSNKSDTNKLLDDQSNKSNTNKPLDDQSNKSNVKICYMIIFENKLNLDDVKKYFNDIVVYTNYMYDKDNLYNKFIVYEMPQQINSLLNKPLGKYTIYSMTNTAKIHLNGMDYKKYNSVGLIETSLLMIIGSFQQTYKKDIILKSIVVNGYDIINVEGLKWEYIENLMNKLSMYSDVYQISLYLI